MNAAASGLQLDKVALSLHGRPLLGPLTLDVRPGTVVTVMGPSGCGKSSLLAFLCGTLDPVFAAEGAIWLDGVALGSLPPERRRVGILFQDDLLFPHMSVGENLAFGLPAALRGRTARRARVDMALTEAGLAGFAERDPATLSGGQRARVALMRILLSEPRALLLDEPFARLDAALRDRFRRFVFDHARALGLPALMVTHDPADADAAGGVAVDLTPPLENGPLENGPLDNAPLENAGDGSSSGTEHELDQPPRRQRSAAPGQAGS